MFKLLGKALSAFIIIGILSGCGSDSGSSSSPSGTAPIVTPPPPVTTKTLSLESGNNQTTIVGQFLALPLTVKIIDSNGDPVTGVDVKFSGTNGVLGSNTVKTNTLGKASTTFKFNGILGNATIMASSTGIGSVVFGATSRLPKLGEVDAGQLNAGAGLEPISGLFALMTNLTGYGQVIVLLNGTDPNIDVSGLPTVSQLLGGTIQGIPAADYPVVFASVSDIVTTPLTTAPDGGEIAGRYLSSNPGSDLPVRTDLIINGKLGVLGILGDPTGITTDTLGGLIAGSATVAGVPVADLPLYLVKAEDFPADPAASFNSFSTRTTGAVPVFDGISNVAGGGAAYIPLASTALSMGSSSLVTINGDIAKSGLILLNPPSLVGTAAERATLTPLPVEYIAVFNVVQDEIIPLMTSTEPVLTSMGTSMQDIGQILQNNQALLQSLADMAAGGNVDPMDMLTQVPELIEFLGSVMPEIDNILNDLQTLIPVLDAQLDIMIDSLLPAILDALPEDGIAFGGQSDGDGSTVRDDVIPLMIEQLTILQASLPAIQQLLADIDDMLPDQINGIFDLLPLIGGFMGGGMDTIEADLNALVPFMTMAAESFDTAGIPIMFDMLEQAESTYLPGESPISGFEGFQTMLDSLTQALPPDATLGDLPGFGQWGAQLGAFLPPELGDPATIGIFTDIIPTIGSVDIGADVLPALRTGLEGLDAAMPDIISQISTFTFDFGAGLGGFLGGGG